MSSLLLNLGFWLPPPQKKTPLLLHKEVISGYSALILSQNADRFENKHTGRCYLTLFDHFDSVADVLPTTDWRSRAAGLNVGEINGPPP